MDAAGELERAGRVWFRNALRADQLSLIEGGGDISGRPGARLGLDRSILAALAPVTALAATLVPGARPVRLVAFDKNEDMNWGLPWHQDRVVALRERVEARGFFNWTRKAGVWHAEPPPGVMDEMLFARVHLDAADVDNGCLELALGSHALGKVADTYAASTVAQHEQEACVAARGDVLFAKALILHRSRPSQTPAPRRALRIDYSALDLPPPMQWAIEA